MKRLVIAFSVLACGAAAAAAAEPPRVLTNHLGYDAFGPKRAVVRGTATDHVRACDVRTYPDGQMVQRAAVSDGTAVDRWRDWRFWSVDFSDVQREGDYTLDCWTGEQTLRSFPFKVQANIIERWTLFDVLSYFKGQRGGGAIDKADSRIPFADKRPSIDARGGWYDASGDYGIHMSQLDHSSFFNNQQVPLVVYNLVRTFDILRARDNGNFNQIIRRAIDESTFGADFLVRMKKPGGSFYQTINGMGPEKRAEDRQIGPVMTGFSLKKTATDTSDRSPVGEGIYESSYRGGGGFAIAGLAMASKLPRDGDFTRAVYLKSAEDAFAYLEAHNRELLNDGKENIVDDYCALAAATELLRATGKPVYAAAAKRRADQLLGRLVTTGAQAGSWRADDADRPFFHPSDAGAPVVTLLAYYDLAGAALQPRILDTVRRSLAYEMRVTGEVANPFGLARQYVQNIKGERRTAFFFPHDTETAPWWQGENARLGSLSTAARLAVPYFNADPGFQRALATYATDQLNWVLGLNPFDASMLQGTGRNNPEYGFFDSWQYRNAPGGIVNGVTSGITDEHGIDFNVPFSVTGQDADWRWGEQWLPHAAWYMLAAAAGGTAAAPPAKAVIGYVFSQDAVVDPARIPAEKLTHINYAFANIKDGQVVEGFRNDAENFRILNALKQRNPALKVLISVGGWTWSGDFSDASLTAASRKRFADSAVAFMTRHKLDGVDIDWEFPGQKGMNNVNRPEDKQNYTLLLKDLRTALDAAGQGTRTHYLLTSATQAADDWLDHTEMGEAAKYLDFVNLMAYDQFDSSEGTAAHHAPLYTHPDNPKQLSAALVIDHYIAAGVPPEKITLGVPFYGHASAQVEPVDNGLYQAGVVPTERLGTFYGNLSAQLVDKQGFVRYWDDISAAPYLYNAARKIFISYDDPQSIRLKGQYVRERGLGGMMFWEMNGDPRHELIDAMVQSLRARAPKTGW